MAVVNDLNNFKLFDLPDQLLSKVFQHLNDADLLSATRICKRIKSIAKEAFELKYNGESSEKMYEVIVRTDDGTEEPKPYWSIFNTFGENIKAIRFNFSDLSNITKNHWIFRTIRQKCPSVEKLEINCAHIDLDSIIDFSKLTHLSLHNLKITSSSWIKNVYPSLISFHATHIENIKQEHFNEFIIKNAQIQELILSKCDGLTIDVLKKLSNNMTELRSLELIVEAQPFSSEVINLEKLERIKISVDNMTAADILNAFSKGCKNLQKLELVAFDCDCDIGGDIIDVICTLSRLQELKIFGNKLDLKLILILVGRLADLISLQILGINKKILKNDVLKLFELGKKLTKLHIQVDPTYVMRQSAYRKSYLPAINSNFLNEFNVMIGDRDAKFIVNDGDKIIVTKDKIVRLKKKHVFIDMNNLPEAEKELCKKTGEISKLSVTSIASRDSETKKQLWNQLIAKHGEAITELNINRVYHNDLTGFNFSFPNLVKLELSEFRSKDFNVFKLFDFPKLTHFEMYEYSIGSSLLQSEMPAGQLNIINHFKNLISIKLDQLDKFRKNVFEGMNDEACARIKNISVGNYNDDANEISRMIMVNVISRFRNLTELNIIHTKFENVNFRHLFENCSKLVKLSLGFDSHSNFNNAKQLFKCVQQNCKQIQTIQLIQRADPDLDDEAEEEEEEEEEKMFIGDKSSEFEEIFLNGIADLFPNVALLVVGINYGCGVVKEKRVIHGVRPL